MSHNVKSSTKSVVEFVGPQRTCSLTDGCQKDRKYGNEAPYCLLNDLGVSLPLMAKGGGAVPLFLVALLTTILIVEYNAQVIMSVFVKIEFLRRRCISLIKTLVIENKIMLSTNHDWQI